MDLNAIWPAATGLSGILGGYVAGKFGATGQAANVNQLLQSRIDLLEQDKLGQAGEIQNLKDQVRIITEMVTQRAPVEQVQATVDRIEVKIDQLLPSPPAGP